MKKPIAELTFSHLIFLLKKGKPIRLFNKDNELIGIFDKTIFGEIFLFQDIVDGTKNAGLYKIYKPLFKFSYFIGKFSYLDTAFENHDTPIFTFITNRNIKDRFLNQYYSEDELLETSCLSYEIY